MKDIKVLRAKTSAGMALCKEALEKCKGNMEKAIVYINERSDVINRIHNLTGAKIGLCKIALLQGITERCGESVKDRLNTNKRIVVKIDAEIERRRIDNGNKDNNSN